MPSVPRIDRSVETQKIGMPQIPTLGVNVPKLDATQVFNAAENLLKEEKNKADQLAYLDYDTQLAGETIRLQVEAMKRQGRDALNFQSSIEDYDKYASTLTNTLTNNTQKAAAYRSMSVRRVELDRALQTHAASEVKKFEDNTYLQAKTNDLDVAILNFRDDSRIKSSIAHQKALTLDYAKSNGYTAEDEWTKRMIAADTSAIHKNIINRYLANGEDLLAKNYFTQNRTEITGTDIADIEHKVDAASTYGEAERIAAKVWEEIGPKFPNDAVKLYDIEKEIRSLTVDNEKVAKAALATAREASSTWNLQQAETEKALVSGIMIDVNKGLTLGRLRKDSRFIELSGQQQTQIQDYMMRKDKEVDLETRLTQAAAWGRLISNPDELASADLEGMLMRNEIDKNQYSDLVKLRVKADPMKSQRAELARQLLNRTASSRMFDDDKQVNNDEWFKAQTQLREYVTQNWDKPDYNPEEFVQTLIKPKEESWLSKIADLFRIDSMTPEQFKSDWTGGAKTTPAPSTGFKQSYDKKPPASEHTGRIMKYSGKTYRSDGKTWKEVK